MPVTVVAMVTFNDDEPLALAEYFRVTGPLLERAGAKITKTFDINEVVVGYRPARKVFIVEYPDKAAVDMVFQSREYKAVIPSRDLAFTEYSVTIAADENHLIEVTA
ncbi:DUF1330 domain-containing protein [Cognatishimia maritima]|uniref:Uncharacterized conserved protein, DUF1330 family n=1 Tax=Cognatishimia maritima TaxID=870908 RepID=A0A1M5JQE7_9RHOB|nr:DUF1330 domain-containing protein [Cognatishimia maritima]SHG42771.1 Uncharacterized conserved protein, DUF1330 family [Cognatishimia maritima]